MSDVQVTIVGGGIVGCAVAEVCGRLGLSAVLVEREAGLGRGTTSRNSEVSHGGMYYPTGSLKARFCVRGRHLLKDFCARAGVEYRQCGKLIVAVRQEELPALQEILDLGLANGVEDLEILDSAQVARLEPNIEAVAALWSPHTGILDAEGAARAFARAGAENGVQIMTSSVVQGLERRDGSWRVDIQPAADRRREGWTHTSDFVVNAAGLSADRVAALAGVDIVQRGWRLVLVKGNYFRIDPRHAGQVARLVYPLPPVDHSSLGVHLCVDLAGQLRLGPDVQWDVGDKTLDPDRGLSYHVDPQRADSFFRGARTFLPWLERADLSPDMSGYRPKLARTGFRDFIVQRETGLLAGLINLIGIDSPGLTSGAALAEEVGRLLMDNQPTT